MTTIERFFTTSFTIKRMTWSGDSSAEVTQTGTKSGHLQQAEPRLIEQLRQDFTLSHILWCDDSVDIQKGDTVVIGSDTYSVRAVQSNDHAGQNKHKEVYLQKDVVA